MRKLAVLTVFLGVSVQLSSAAPACTNGSLSSYLALGSGGCTIGSNTFASFTVLNGITGATAIMPSGITLTPTVGSQDPGLTTTVNVTAQANNIFQAIFTYQLTGNSYANSAVTLSNSSVTGDGAVTGLQNYCAGGVFGPDGLTGCSGTAGSLLTLNGLQNQDANSLNASLLGVTNDLTIDGGQSGTASGGTLTNSFSSVPEPTTLYLMVLGAALTIGGRLRSHNIKSARR